MKTLTEIIDITAAEAFPGSAFSTDLMLHATQLLEKELVKASKRALRKAIISYRPVSQHTASDKLATVACVGGALVHSNQPTSRCV